MTLQEKLEYAKGRLILARDIARDFPEAANWAQHVQDLEEMLAQRQKEDNEGKPCTNK